MEKSFVSMEKKMCVICGNEHETGDLLFDTSLRKNFDRFTTTGYDHCNDCQKKIDDHFIAMVEISNSPSNDIKILKKEDANRTGIIVWVKNYVAAEVFNVEIKTPMVFVEPKVVEYLKTLTPVEDGS